jgi:hypothetical protein
MPRRYAQLAMRFGLMALASLCSTLLLGQPKPSVFGTLEDVTGTLIPNAIAFLASESVASARFIVHTDGVGSYRFPHLTPGAYRLELQAPGFVTVTVSLQVSPDTPTMRQRTVLQSVPNLACSRDVYPRDIRLLPIGAAHGSLAGVLRVSRPPSNARVAPRKVSVVVQRAGRELARVETDGNTFRVADLDPGRYSVQITGTGVYAEIWDITVRENLETEYEFPLSLCPDRGCDPAQRHKGEPVVICQ